jgi:hypothetical protein
MRAGMFSSRANRHAINQRPPTTERDLDVQDKAEFVPMTFERFFQRKLQQQT